MIKELIPGCYVLVLNTRNFELILNLNKDLLELCDQLVFTDKNGLEYLLLVPKEGLHFENNGNLCITNGARFADENYTYNTNIPFVLT